jgi:hypothetical protein
VIDLISQPPHYLQGIETNDYIKSWGMSYAEGNVIKYLTRYRHKSVAKEDQLADLKKARWYLDDLINELHKS